jgi:hypothetical protein
MIKLILLLKIKNIIQFMFDIKKVFGLNVCCYKKFIKNKCKNLITLVNIGILYNFGITIYNYSYNIGYNCMNTILYIDENILKNAILDSFHLIILLMGICFWLAITDLIIELFNCNKH